MASKSTLTPSEKKDKARWSRILKVYGITKDQYYALDKGLCPICTREWSDTVKPCVDHDHVSGEIRGLLCLYCNHRMVGRHRDADLVQRIATYLRETPRGWIVPPKPKKKRKKKNESSTNPRQSRSSRSSK
jgi:hypothetical protein